jgi:hypothetical protein
MKAIICGPDYSTFTINPNPVFRMADMPRRPHIYPPDRWFTFAPDDPHICSCGKPAVKGWWVHPKGITNSYCADCLATAPENKMELGELT